MTGKLLTPFNLPKFHLLGMFALMYVASWFTCVLKAGRASKNTTDSDTKLFGLLNLDGDVGKLSTVGDAIILTPLYGM